MKRILLPWLIIRAIPAVLILLIKEFFEETKESIKEFLEIMKDFLETRFGKEK